MSLLYAPLDKCPELLSRLHLHAVLPAFEDLLQYNRQARTILGDSVFGLRLQVRGLAGDLSFKRGECRFGRNPEASPSVVLHFLSFQQLNNQFTGRGLTLPLPIRGGCRIGALRKFTALSNCLKASLRPELACPMGEDREAIACHLKMSFSVVLASTTILIEHEHYARKLFAGQGDWLVSLRVDRTDIAGWVQCQGGQLCWGRGMPEAPISAELVFSNTQTAMRAMDGNLDNFAAVNGGTVRINGLAPLVEKLGLVMDRVPAYLDA